MSWQHHEKRIGGNRYFIAAAVMISALTAVLDSTIVNVSIPTMQAAFGADIDQITWVVTGFLISNVVIIPMTGWLSNLIGLKRYYMISQVVFVVASMLCGLAWSLPSMVVFRILQGIGGGALLPVSLSIMLEAFPAEQTATAMAIFGLGAVLGPIVGPVLGGWLTENLSWRWIFYVNLPIVIVGLLMTWFAIKVPHGKEQTERGPIDFWGLALVTISLGTLQVVLQNGQREDWFNSFYITAFSLLSVAAGALFVWWELRVEYPFINLRIFLDRNFTAGVLLGVAVAVALFGSIFIIPIFCAQILHYNALDIGLMLLPAALMAIPMFPITARLVQVVDPRILAALGFVGITISNWLNSHLDAQTSNAALIWYQGLRSFCLPLIFVPLSVIGLQFLPQREKPDASSLSNLTRTLGGSLSVAAIGSYIINREQFHLARLSEYVTQFGQVTQARLAQLQAFFQSRAGSDPTVAHQQALALVHNQMFQQAVIFSFDDAFRVLTVAAAVAILIPFAARSIAASQTKLDRRMGREAGGAPRPAPAFD